LRDVIPGAIKHQVGMSAIGHLFAFSQVEREDAGIGMGHD
jgi:hypothetical protein